MLKSLGWELQNGCSKGKEKKDTYWEMGMGLGGQTDTEEEMKD